jgi:hypothetical protein
MTSPNSVSQTTLNAQQAIGNESLCDLNSFNHSAQLDSIKDLDREQRDRRTLVARRVEIRGFLQNLEVNDHAEGPAAKRINLSRNGKPAHEVLILHSSKKKQLALPNTDFNAIMAEAMAFIRTLGGEIDPEWNWHSWSNYRGRIEVASEFQAEMVTAMFNSLEVAGVPAFRMWRAKEIVELTSVKLKLDGGHLYTVPVDEIIQGLLTKHGVRGTYSDPKNITDMDKNHVVYFMADPTMRSGLGKFQKGSGKFFLNLWGMDRELYMARDPLVVAAEEAAVMRVRVETALAKAIAASDRLALVPAELAVVTTGGEEEEQQGKLRENTQENNTARNSMNHLILGPPVNQAMGEFMRNFQRVQREHKERREGEQQQRQQQQEQQQQQQQPPAGLADYHDWEAVNLPRSGTTTPAAATAAAAATANNNKQQQQHQGKATFSIINYLTDKQTTYPPGVVKERIASIEDQAASPPHGVDPLTLVGGLPQHDSSFSSTSSAVSIIIRKQKPKPNTSTGSVEVDGLELKLGDADMETNKEEDADLYEQAKDNSDMDDGGDTT